MRAKRTLSPKFLKIKRKKVALFIVGKGISLCILGDVDEDLHS